MTYFIAEGYGAKLGRRSEKKTFTHAVIFRNISNGDLSAAPNATFHVSLKLAEAEMKRMTTRTDWLIPLGIVEVKAECAHSDWVHEYSDDSTLGDAYWCADCYELMQVG